MSEKIRSIIVDDEPPAVEALQALLGKIEMVEVVHICYNSFDAFSFIKENEIDLVFLDISMPEMSGLDMLKSLTHPPPVIMTTAHREHAVEAFDLDVVDYLLKPISAERLMKAISRFLERKKQPSATIQDSFQSGSQNESSLFVRADRRFRKVNLNQIKYIESLKDYIKIYTSDEVIITRMTMKEMEVKLPAKQFLRVHRSFIVNREKITAVTSYDIEIGDTEIPIGSNYKDMVDQLIRLSGDVQ